MAESADALDSGSSRGNSVEVQVLLSAPNQKESLWRLFLILQVILRGLEPGKVSAFGKCAGGTFSAGSARAVPHAKREVSRANSMRRRSRRIRSNPATPAKQRTGTFVPVLCFFQDSNLRRFAVKKQRPYFRKDAIIIELRLFSFAHMNRQIGIIYSLYLLISRAIIFFCISVQIRHFPVYCTFRFI